MALRKNRPEADIDRADGGHQVSKEQYDQRDVDKVALFPTFRDIPEPSLPLGDKGRETYDSWCRTLYDLGRLTKVTRGHVETLALADQAIAMNLERGKPPSSKTIEQRMSALRRLEVADIDGAVAPTQPTRDAFAALGFARRLREVEAKDRG